LDQQAHLDLQAQQARALLDLQVLKDQLVHQVVQQVQLVQQVAREPLVQQAHAVQQARLGRKDLQALRLLFLGQPDLLVHKVLQLTLEDQLQIQQRCLQVATLSMMHTS
jgi:hypothetical protein